MDWFPFHLATAEIQTTSPRTLTPALTFSRFFGKTPVKFPRIQSSLRPFVVSLGVEIRRFPTWEIGMVAVGMSPWVLRSQRNGPPALFWPRNAWGAHRPLNRRPAENYSQLASPNKGSPRTSAPSRPLKAPYLMSFAVPVELAPPFFVPQAPQPITFILMPFPLFHPTRKSQAEPAPCFLL